MRNKGKEGNRVFKLTDFRNTIKQRTRLPPFSYDIIPPVPLKPNLRGRGLTGRGLTGRTGGRTGGLTGGLAVGLAAEIKRNQEL